MKVEAIREPKPPLKAVGIVLEPYEAEQLRDLFNMVYGRDPAPYPVAGVNMTRAKMGEWARVLTEALS